MATEMSIFLFGPPRIECAGTAVHLPRRKALALLAYLAAEHQPHSRDALAALLWPDLSQPRARAMVRHALLSLHQALGRQWLSGDSELLALAPQQGLAIDVREFRALLVRVAAHGHAADELCPECADALVAALALYQDSFLAGFSLPAADEYERWQNRQAEQYQHQASKALEQLAGFYAQSGQRQLAVDYAQRWLALDPTHEPAHRMLMHLHLGAGDRAAALMQYRECERALANELGVEPDPQTMALAEQIRTGQSHVTAAADPVRVQQAGQANIRMHGLPSHLLEFIGRASELAQISHQLGDPACRLLNLVGPGGIGKTRLAIEAARRQADIPDTFTDGVWFIDAAAAANPDNLPLVVLHSLGVPSDGTPAQPRLLDYLATRHLLVVLDSCEHLATGADLLAAWLKAAPGLKLLITSRVRMNLHDEWLYPVPGLALPHQSVRGPGVPYDLAASDAVRLFLHCARRLQPMLAGSSVELADVAEVCRLLDGSPLAIELAAAWLRVMPLHQLSHALSSGLHLLSTSLHDMPSRHSSMRAVFDQSWLLLSPRERSVLCQLSACRGCTGAAAAAIAGAELEDLTGLVDKSWLHLDDAGRFVMHEACRQYCGERLPTTPDSTAELTLERIGGRHCAYYAAFLAEKEQQMNRQPAVLGEIERELANIHAAWTWAVDHADGTKTGQMLFGLVFLAEMGGRTGFVLSVLDAAFADMQAARDDHPLLARMASVMVVLAVHLGWLTAADGYLRTGSRVLERSPRTAHWQEEQMHLQRAAGVYHCARGEWRAALRIHQELLHIVEDSGVSLWPFHGKTGVSFWLAQFAYLCGSCLWGLGNTVRAQEYLQRSIAHCDAIGEQRFKAHVLDLLAYIHLEQGATAEARNLIDLALTISTTFGDRLWVSHQQVMLGRIAAATGHFAVARRHAQAALSFAQDTGELFPLQESLHLLGAIDLAQGRPDEAEQWYAESLSALHARGCDRYFLQAAGFAGLGSVALARAELVQAESYFGQALAGAGSVAWDSAYALAGLAQTYARQGRLEAAVLFAAVVVKLEASSWAARTACTRLLDSLQGTVAPERYAALLASASSVRRDGEDIGELYLRLAAEGFDGDAAEQHDSGDQADDLEREHGAVPHHLAAGQAIGDVADQTAGDIAEGLAGEVGHAPSADIEAGGLGDGHVKHEAEVGDGHQPAAEPKHEDGAP